MSKIEWATIKVPKVVAQRAREKLEDEKLYPNLSQLSASLLRKYIAGEIS